MNETIFYFFYNLSHQSDFFDKVVIFFADIFPYIAVMLALLFLFFYHRTLKEFFIVFFSSFLAYGISVVLKIIFHTSRPFLSLPELQALFPETGFAFPSSHAAFFMAMAFSLFFLHKKAGYIFGFFALLIGITRIIAGVHFPIDILGGFVLGTLVAYVVAYFSKNV